MEDVLEKELQGFVLISLDYEFWFYEYGEEIMKPYKSLLILLNKEQIDYHYRLHKRDIRFSDNKEHVNYYYEKGEVELKSLTCEYIPFISELCEVQIVRIKDTIRLFILGIDYAVEYTYIMKGNLWY